jgi:glycosyltransferase involved in cell wall biosynthesis
MHGSPRPASGSFAWPSRVATAFRRRMSAVCSPARGTWRCGWRPWARGGDPRAALRVWRLRAARAHAAETGAGAFRARPDLRRAHVPRLAPRERRRVLRGADPSRCRGGAMPWQRAHRARLRAAGVPVILYFRNVEMEELGGDPATVGASACIANSRFTARSYRNAFGLHATVIPPTIDARRYRVASDGSAVVFINPVAEKGLDRAIAIAAQCPDIPFLFVESWRLSPPRSRRFPRGSRRIPTSPSSGASTTCGRSMPARGSCLRRASGRRPGAASRPRRSAAALPVIGSDRGGLPEAIGPGGVIIPAEADLAGWVAAVRRLWSDKRHYDELSAHARLHAERPEIDPEVQFRDLPRHRLRRLRPAKAASTRDMARLRRRIAVVIPYYQRDPGILSRALDSVRAQELPRGVSPACLRGGRRLPPAGRGEIADASALTLMVQDKCRPGRRAKRRARPDRGRWRRGFRGLPRFR